ncbi:MAG: phenylalanine--tRNA ligase subunit beta [Candidatus Aenigmarchaeota archaeon]|nr:phenylalanine--tRNA ligase subunit beta [Candidatus Aenigmarchaeota archaeon]
MAVVTFDRKDFESLVGKKLKDSDYTETVPMIGVTTEELSSDSVSFEVFPNRPDMLSVEGFARALKAFMGDGKGIKYSVGKIHGTMRVDKSVENVRPYAVCAVVRNVKLTDSVLKSLMQFQEKVHETFGRRRERVAIGVHDMSKIEFPLKYAAYEPSKISFVPLDSKEKMNLSQILQKHGKGKEYGWVLENYKTYPVITDAKNDVLSFPPIINGELTRVTEKSKDLFIDVTGTSKHYIMKTLNMLCASLADRGAKLEAVKIDYTKSSETTPDASDQKIKVSLDYLNGLLDTDLKEDEVKMMLAKMGVLFANNVASVPFYRTDVMHQIDIVEDVAIAFGYQNFEPRIPKIPTMAQRNRTQEKSCVIKEIMVGLGMEETVSFVLTNDSKQFNMMAAPVEECATILNPKTEDYTACRKSLIPSLMNVLGDNKHNEYPQRIFEIGDCVELDKSETGASNVRKLAVALCHADADINEIKSVLETFMHSYGLGYRLKNSAHPSLMSGRCGEIIVDGRKVGIIGEINPAVLKNWGLDNPVAVLEMVVE